MRLSARALVAGGAALTLGLTTLGVTTQAGAATTVRWAPANKATIHPGVVVTIAGVKCIAGFVMTDGHRVFVAVPGSCAGVDDGAPTDGCTAAQVPYGLKVTIQGARYRGRMAYSLRGSAMLRWRTGDLTESRIDATPCAGCGRTVPRLRALRRAALVLASDDGRALDLRSLAGALAGRADVNDWRVVLQRRARDGRTQVVVHVATAADPGQVAAGAAGDVRSLAGVLPTQMVVGEELPAAVSGEALTPRIVVRG